MFYPDLRITVDTPDGPLGIEAQWNEEERRWEVHHDDFRMYFWPEPQTSMFYRGYLSDQKNQETFELVRNHLHAIVKKFMGPTTIGASEETPDDNREVLGWTPLGWRVVFYHEGQWHDAEQGEEWTMDVRYWQELPPKPKEAQP